MTQCEINDRYKQKFILTYGLEAFQQRRAVNNKKFHENKKLKKLSEVKEI